MVDSDAMDILIIYTVIALGINAIVAIAAGLIVRRRRYRKYRP